MRWMLSVNRKASVSGHGWFVMITLVCSTNQPFCCGGKRPVLRSLVSNSSSCRNPRVDRV